MQNIVGVRYIGSKQRKEDNVLNTGVFWVPGQVINFDAASAATLAQHTGVWEITDVDHDAETKVVGTVKKAAGDPRKYEPQTFANVNAMDKEQLHAFARTTLLRQLPDFETDKLREEVKSLLTLNFLDDQQGLAAAKNPEDKLIISLHVSQEEFNAFESGELVLKLVPKAASGAQTGGNSEPVFKGDLNFEVGTFNESIGLAALQGRENSLTSGNIKPTPADLDDALEQLPGEYTPEDVESVVTQMKGYFGELFTQEVESTVRALFKPAESSPAGNPSSTSAGNTEKTNADPQADLKATLELLETKALRDMVKQAGLPVSNTMTKEKLIEKLLAAAEAK